MRLNPGLGDRLNRAINRTSPQHPEARRIVSKANVRDTHPTTGAGSVMWGGTDGSQPRQTTTLNTITSTGQMDKAFHFGVMGFGWGDGIL